MSVKESSVVPAQSCPESPRLQVIFEALRKINWKKRGFVLIAAVYVAAAFFQSPIEDSQLADVPHIRVGDGAIAPPMVLSGDSPHYLLLVNSIIADGDVDLANNYREVASGGWGAGARFRGVVLDHHTEADRWGKERSIHSIFLPLLLAPIALPFRGTQWVEPVCILVTLAGTLAAFLLFVRRSGLDPRWLLVLAFATPLWCYARDVWTEPWLAIIWIGLLFSGSLPTLFLLGLGGTMIKYNFVLIPLTMAAVFWIKGERRKAYVLAASGVLGIVIVIGVVQYLFQDVGHFNLFHLGGHYRTPDAPLRHKIAPLWPRFSFLVGLLFHPEAGLLPFFPFLAWGLWHVRKGGPVLLPALAFLLLHAMYPGWHGAIGFSARYLVPLVPALVIGVAQEKPRGWLFASALVYGGLMGILAGVYPSLAFDRTPVQIFKHLWTHLWALAGW